MQTNPNRIKSGPGGGQFTFSDSRLSEAGEIDLGTHEVPMGLKGAIDMPRFSLETGGDSVVRGWSAMVGLGGHTKADMSEMSETVTWRDRSITIPIAGVRTSDSLYQACARARAIETTMHSDDWGDDDEYRREYENASQLRTFMGQQEYEKVVCGGQPSTLD